MSFTKLDQLREYSDPKFVMKKAEALGYYPVHESSRKDKKYMVKNPDGKMVHFGAVAYADYTSHKDEERRKRFRLYSHKWSMSPKWSPA